MLLGKLPHKDMWQKYYKLPDRLRQIGNAKQHILFKRGSYIDPVLLIARQMRDETISSESLVKFHSKNKIIK